MSESNPGGPIDTKRLLSMVLVRFGLGMTLIGVIIFLPAGSLSYTNGWVFMGTFTVLMFVAFSYLLRRDPELLERRMRLREKEAKQRRVISLSLLVFLAQFILPGLDWRFGWSKVPAWLVVAATVLLVAGYVVFMIVMRFNSFLSRVVEVQEGQKVIDTGPYALVRHPMYVGVLAIYLASPLVLGSYWALIPALAFIPVLVARITNEEEVLAKGLAGYEEYRKKVRWRLCPGIW